MNERLFSLFRAVAICDSESDVEENNYRPIFDQDNNRKRLSFSDDESDSSTSEFDPGEEVPPKSKGKKGRDDFDRLTDWF